MRTGIGSLLVVLAGLALVAPAQAAKAPETRNDYRVTYVVKAKYDDVREQVVQAINGKGIQINNVSYIGAMLLRTGKDLGYKKQIYTKAQAFEFCSATVSRFTMEADPHNVVFCPYIIALYELAGQEGTIYVSYRRPELVGSEQSRKSLQGVEALIEEIVQEALSWF